ncbi:hypothetical protein [Streptomyces sp. NPDC051994]|uniref:hypothetical protein n=1 Tax=unclassified Streptomyces TaxID=2593676 RepID=UPI0034393955
MPDTPWQAVPVPGVMTVNLAAAGVGLGAGRRRACWRDQRESTMLTESLLPDVLATIMRQAIGTHRAPEAHQ